MHRHSTYTVGRAFFAALALIAFVVLAVAASFGLGVATLNHEGSSVGVNVGDCGVYVNVVTAPHAGAFCGDY